MEKKLMLLRKQQKQVLCFYSTGKSGEPLFPIVETPVDTVTDLAGEKIWPTQPIPQKPAPFVRQSFTEKDLNPYLSTEEYDDVKKSTGYLSHGQNVHAAVKSRYYYFSRL